MADINANQDTGRFQGNVSSGSTGSVRPAVPPVPSAEVGVADVRVRDVQFVHPAAVSRISWRAIIAGMVTAVALQAVLTTLGSAIGLSIIDYGAASATTMKGVSIYAGI